jgi:hypothetical protein
MFLLPYTFLPVGAIFRGCTINKYSAICLANKWAGGRRLPTADLYKNIVMLETL